MNELKEIKSSFVELSLLNQKRNLSKEYYIQIIQ